MTPTQSPTRRIRARCPRDHGRLVLEQDPQGTYLSCLRCGYVLEEWTHARPDPRPLPVWWRAHSTWSPAD
jgi:hypothetical protein